MASRLSSCFNRLDDGSQTRLFTMIIGTHPLYRSLAPNCDCDYTFIAPSVQSLPVRSWLSEE